MPRPNEIATDLREIVGREETGSRCGYCDHAHEIIERPERSSSRIGFKVSTHSKHCLIGKLRDIPNIGDENFA